MPNRHHTRLLAMQVLYQIDMAGLEDRDTLVENIEDEAGAPQAKVEAAELAIAAWASHTAADEQISALTPDWPTHRQPPVDRAILRLAYHEMVSGHAPVNVAINEAVELAKQFGGENSPSFINGVLDKLSKKIEVPAADETEPKAKPEPKPAADAWLKDAIDPEA